MQMPVAALSLSTRARTHKLQPGRARLPAAAKTGNNSKGVELDAEEGDAHVGFQVVVDFVGQHCDQLGGASGREGDAQERQPQIAIPVLVPRTREVRVGRLQTMVARLKQSASTQICQSALPKSLAFSQQNTVTCRRGCRANTDSHRKRGAHVLSIVVPGLGDQRCAECEVRAVHEAADDGAQAEGEEIFKCAVRRV